MKKKPESCGIEKTAVECHQVHASPRVQPFPSTGALVKNLNQSLDAIQSRIRNVDAIAYSYVVTTVNIVKTVNLSQEVRTFEQIGSAPNFQGGRLTLCTCKHQMRSSQNTVDDWKNLWVAGFTSRSQFDRKHWLFYLAQIDQGYESHRALWNSLTPEARDSKAADENYLGDVFKPKDSKLSRKSQFLPSHYIVPEVHAHRQKLGDRGWRNDISYRHSKRFGDPALLVAKPRMTFLWDKPLIHFARKTHCRNYHKWDSIQDLLALLCEVPR